MKFTTEKTWGSAHIHYNGSYRKRTMDKWASAANSRRSESEDPNVQLCSGALAGVFREAVRRCPSISIDDDIMEGQPCIEGTRIPVRAVVRALEIYGSIDGAVKCYPHLNEQQVKDALYFTQIVLEQPSGIDELAAIA